MSASVVASSCRLTIVSSTLRVDLAVPQQLSIAELLTLVVSSLGRETADLGAAEGGWVLQRPGQAPLDPSLSVAASQLRDGDTLHLRTRSSHLPEIAFDDVLDAVATGVATRTARWRPEHTARAAAGMAGALLTVVLLVLALTGPSWAPVSIAAGVVTVLLVLAALATGRMSGHRLPALTAGGYAVAAGALAGATALGGDDRVVAFGAPHLLVGAAAVVLVSVVLLGVLGAGYAGFVATATLALLIAIGTGLATATDLGSAATAAVVATVALALSPFLPALSFRLARLPLPSIPQDAGDLRRDTGTIESEQILGQAVRADQFLTGLVGGTAFAIGGAALLLVERGVSEKVLACVLGVICLLRARLFTGRGQRTLLLVAGSLALLAVLVAAVVDVHGTARIAGLVAPAVVVALALIAAVVTLPGRRYTPPVGRTADVIESLLVLSVIPLALAVMGVYGAVRGLASP